jgi:phage terminase small subunit
MARHPANALQPEQPAALDRWPECPDDFTVEEGDAWKRLGRALLPARLVTVADLLIAEECARVMARVRKLYADEDLKATTLKAWLDLQTKMLGELGLSPKARKNIAVPKPAPKKSALADVLD